MNTAKEQTTLIRTVVREYRDEGNLLQVLTLASPEGFQPFETLIRHPEFKNGNPIVVAAYDDQDSAEEGHDQWLDTMSAKELPNELKDIGNWAGVQTVKTGSQQRLAASYPRRKPQGGTSKE